MLYLLFPFLEKSSKVCILFRATDARNGQINKTEVLTKGYLWVFFKKRS